jgi:hypothetical protein
MVQNTRGYSKTYSVSGVGDYKAKVLESSVSGLLLNIDGQDDAIVA